MIVDVLFAEQAVAADGESMIAGEDDNRVLEFSRAFECGEDAADLRVQVLDLETLIAIKERIGRPKDQAVLPVLRETLAQSKK